MKLVEGAGSRAGELPQAESCAVHEGEDDDEDVHIKSGGIGGSSAFFTRFKNFRKVSSTASLAYFFINPFSPRR